MSISSNLNENYTYTTSRIKNHCENLQSLDLDQANEESNESERCNRNFNSNNVSGRGECIYDVGVTLGDFGLTPSPDAAPVAAAEGGNAAAAGTGEATVGLDADAFEAAVATLQVVAALQNIIFSLKKLFGMGGVQRFGG